MEFRPSADFSGKEVAYAENTALNQAVTASVADIPALSIVVPANTADYNVEVYLPLISITSTAVNGAAIVNAMLIDDAAVIWAYTTYRIQIPASGSAATSPLFIKRRMSTSSSAKTLKVQTWGTLSSATAAILSGTGNTTGLFLPPAFVQATLR